MNLKEIIYEKNDEKYYIEELKKVLTPAEQETLYGLDHTYNIEPKTVFAKVNFSINTLRSLIVYIEKIAWDFTYENSYSLSEEEVLELINQFYAPVTLITPEALQEGEEYQEIDLYWNWEALSHIDFVELVPEIYKAGLREYIEEMAIKNGWEQQFIFSENTTVFC